jgi:tripartite-type tricarboxylate transporter receptor subunit TctC
MRALLRLIALSTVFVSVQSLAQAPAGVVRLISPFAPGGITDLLARALSEELSRELGRNVIVENRPGAGGNIGADVVAKSPPNGQVLLMSSASPLTINEFLYAKMPFDPASAFTPISKLADMHQILVIHPKRVASLQDLLTRGRAEPELFKLGSAGNGSIAHLALVLFSQRTGVKLVHVPYKGAGPAAQDVVAGQIDGNFTNPPTMMSHIQAGTVRALAVAGPKRLAALPEVPTFDESGVKGFEVSSWFGLLAPAGTPAAAVKQLNQAVVKALASPEQQQRFSKLGAQLASSQPEEFAAFIAAERKKWGAVVTSAGIEAK